MTSAPAIASPPAFSASEPIVTDTGYSLIEWRSDGPVSLEIARAGGGMTPDTLYEGTNKSFFISGLANGTYDLTLRDASGAETSAVRLEVAHQSLTQALWLVALGAVVFLLIVATIAKGARDD
ncbi:hypothetical protein [Novosphingobium sp. PC22D]|uniref:hypothetical protein n=1 Tax=Novosphingobium sp. PC22D TaxID=1962403 RepID=UPI001F0AD183|nr:hypothetical protein [Novosphingobium sp. PC22D]